MSAPTTYVDAIKRLRTARSLNLDVATNLRTILKTSGGTSTERAMVAEMAKVFEFNGLEARELSEGIAKMAIANSHEDFEDIIAAVSK